MTSACTKKGRIKLVTFQNIKPDQTRDIRKLIENYTSKHRVKLYIEIQY